MDIERQQTRPAAPAPAARKRHHKWQPLSQLLIGRGLLAQEQLTAVFERQRHLAVVSRLKMLAQLDTAERRLP